MQMAGNRSPLPEGLNREQSSLLGSEKFPALCLRTGELQCRNFLRISRIRLLRSTESDLLSAQYPVFMFPDPVGGVVPQTRDRIADAVPVEGQVRRPSIAPALSCFRALPSASHSKSFLE
jgi:hypothetical protein